MKLSERRNGDLKGAVVAMVGTFYNQKGFTGTALGLVTTDGRRLAITIHEESEIDDLDAPGNKIAEYLVNVDVKH